MSQRQQQRAQPPPAPRYNNYCARTGVYMGKEFIADNNDCPVTGERVEDLVCPIRIAGAPVVMELDALLKWREQEVRTAARYGRPLVVHVNPTTRVAYRPEDVRLVRFDGQPVEEYNQNVHRLNAALRDGLLSPYMEQRERDEAHQRAGREGPTLAEVALRRHPATQRFMDEAAALSPSAAAAHVAAAEAERKARRAPMMLLPRPMMMPVDADAARFLFWMLFRSRLTEEEGQTPWPEDLGNELLFAADAVAAGRRTPAEAVRVLFITRDRYLAMQTSRALRLAWDEARAATGRAPSEATGRARSPSPSPGRSPRPRIV
jgi:hypothetical protein